MSGLWISMGLLYVLLHRISADEGVKLICNKTVKVQLRDSVTLNCSINWTQHGHNCMGTEFHWLLADDDTHDGIPCTSNDYTCEWDKLTYVSLTILNVSKEENYTVGMSSNCGMDTSPSIAVQLNEMLPSQEPSINERRTSSHVTAIVNGVLATATFVAVLCCLFKLYRTKCQKTSIHESGESSIPLNI